jgi:ABC-type branched-subunit amino acid transport system ATPase component
MTALIATSKLSAGYNKVSVIRDLELEIRPGEVVALLGPNGAGKTTTIMTLAGELAPIEGHVAWNGSPTTAPLHWRARHGLGLVTEQRAVLTSLTVKENLRVAHCDAGRALEMFPELTEHLSRRVGLLSGGQQQMLALARSLTRRTRLLLADELSLGLAPLVVARLLSAVRAAADDGVGVLLVEQHVHQALAIADRIYVMRKGRVVLQGSAADLRGRVDDIQASYLSSPGTDSGSGPGGAPQPGPGVAPGS